MVFGQHLSWFGHVLRRNTEVGRVLIMEVARALGRGRTARPWKDVVEYDMRVVVMGLEKGMAMDGETWRWRIYGLVNPG